MTIYELFLCEEYWMQCSQGLFQSREGALAAIKGTRMLEAPYADGVLVVTIVRDGDHYAKPRTDKVITREGVEVTAENISDLIGSFKFYDITHAGYNLYGVFPREMAP